MDKGITVKELFAFCERQIYFGNGDKHIVISGDDEGNSYHTLFFEFLTNVDDIKFLKKTAHFHDNNDPNEIVILG